MSHQKSPYKLFTNQKLGALLYEPSPRWIRGFVDGKCVVDCKSPYLVWEGTGLVPLLSIPAKDVKGLQETKCNDTRGDLVSKWYNIQSQSTTKRLAAWSYRLDLANAPPSDNVTFRFSALDKWLEEEEEIFVHPRSPYIRLDVRQSSRHLLVKIDKIVVAETRHPLLLFENSLLTRNYINPTDVKCLGLFRYSEGHHSACPYKGVASYFSATINDKVYEDIVWTYPYPLQDVQKIQNRWCFYNEKVEMILDGEKLE